MNSVCAAPSARHLGEQFAPVLKKVQMPPAPLNGVVNATHCFTFRALKMLSRHVFQAQFQAFGFSLEATLGHSPLLRESKRRAKKFFWRHGCLFSEIQLQPKSKIPGSSLASRKTFALTAGPTPATRYPPYNYLVATEPNSVTHTKQRSAHFCDSIGWVVTLKKICNISFDSLSTGKR